MSLALPSAEQPRVRSYPVDSIEAQSASASIGRQDADSSHLSQLGCVRWTRSRTARASLSAEACFTLPLHCILHPSLHQSEECKRLRILFDRSEAEACTERALNPCEAGTTPPSAARCVTGPATSFPPHICARNVLSNFRDFKPFCFSPTLMLESSTNRQSENTSCCKRLMTQ
jgi:hypothetical protein